MKLLQTVFFILLFFCFPNKNNAQCSDELQNQAGNGKVIFESHSKEAGGDCVTFESGNSSVKVENYDANQPWARYRITIDLATNQLAEGDELAVHLEAEVGSGQQGRLEFAIDNQANTSPSSTTFYSNGVHDDTFTIPANNGKISIWLFSNYTLSTPGSVVYKNLSVINLSAVSEDPVSSENLALNKPASQSGYTGLS